MLIIGGSDFVPGPYQVTFTATQSRREFTVGIVDDTLAELPEMFQLILQPSGMLTVGTDDTATVTIMDNESKLTGSTSTTIVRVV